MMDFASIVLESGVRFMVPLLLASLGELISERSGVINVGLEGMMAGGAFAAFAAAVTGASLPVALLMAILFGAAVGGLMAIGAVVMKGNQILVGFSLFILVPGFANFVLEQLQLSGSTPALTDIAIPGLSQILVIGHALFRQNIFYYASIVLTFSVWVVLVHTRMGLALSAVGHDAQKAQTKGLSPTRVQIWALLACGALAGLGGAALSIGSVGSYTPNIIGGRGFIAIAIVILGRWTVLGAAGGALLMGLLDSLKLNLPQLVNVPIQFLSALPWLVVILMLVFSSRMRSQAPRSLAG